MIEQTNMIEQWQPFPGFSLYAVSDAGRVRNIATGKIKALRPDKDGYLIVDLWKGTPSQRHTLKVARMVLMTFICEPPANALADHRDRNRTNNVLLIYGGRPRVEQPQPHRSKRRAAK